MRDYSHAISRLAHVRPQPCSSCTKYRPRFSGLAYIEPEYERQHEPMRPSTQGPGFTRTEYSEPTMACNITASERHHDYCTLARSRRLGERLGLGARLGLD